MTDKKMDIIRALKRAGTDPISGEELGERLGISRTMVWKYMKALGEEGYVIRSTPGSGHVLVSAPDKLYPSEIMDGLDTGIIGGDIRYFDDVDSTNDVAKKMGSSSDEGTVVIAEMQDSGRGRKGGHWMSPRGGVWMSVILKPNVVPAYAPRFTLMAGVAVAKTIRDLGVEASLKWPNDVLVGDKKVCGILTEMDAESDQINFVVIGMGINVNVSIEDLSEDIRSSSTSLSEIKGEELDRIAFVQALLRALEDEYVRSKALGFDLILDEWKSLSSTIGRDVDVVTPQRMISGKAVGITENGTLLVETSEGLEEVIAGSCIHR
ncbi:biotin--[acetyl-CoA-carboxylase] ligase [Methanococcoides sp. SA1]|nr:biotin--[acetyl-CoA-carboxylase] ligase [Methanococcoides sp. SA1]